MNKAIIRMRENPSLFRAYYQDLRTHSPYGDSECKDQGCKIVKLCGMNNTLHQSIVDCVSRYR